MTSFSWPRKPDGAALASLSTLATGSRPGGGDATAVAQSRRVRRAIIVEDGSNLRMVTSWDDGELAPDDSHRGRTLTGAAAAAAADDGGGEQVQVLATGAPDDGGGDQVQELATGAPEVKTTGGSCSEATTASDDDDNTTICSTKCCSEDEKWRQNIARLLEAVSDSDEDTEMSQFKLAMGQENVHRWLRKMENKFPSHPKS